jgi:hypothetical protein
MRCGKRQRDFLPADCSGCIQSHLALGWLLPPMADTVAKVFLHHRLQIRRAVRSAIE